MKQQDLDLIKEKYIFAAALVAVNFSLNHVVTYPTSVIAVSHEEAVVLMHEIRDIIAKDEDMLGKGYELYVKVNDKEDVFIAKKEIK